MGAEKKRILYVEDDDSCAHLIAGILSEYEVVTASCLAEGWQRITQESYDLCLLDYLLPDGVGVNLYRQIHVYSPQLPVIFVSSMLHEIQCKSMYAAGVKVWLVKPIDGELLQEWVRVLLCENATNTTGSQYSLNSLPPVLQRA